VQNIRWRMRAEHAACAELHRHQGAACRCFGRAWVH
jgi:hypothetical protein